MPIVPTADYETYLGLSSGDATVALLEAEVERQATQFMDWDPIRADHLAYLPTTEPGGNSHPLVTNWGNIPNSGGITNILLLPHKYVRAACGHSDAVNNLMTLWICPGAYAGQAIAFAAEHILTRGTDYVIDFDHHHAAKNIDISRTGHIRRMSGSWPRKRGSVKIVYSAGFSATEFTGALTATGDAWDASDIRQACLMIMASAYHTSRQTLSTGKSTGALTGEAIEGYSYTLDAASVAALSGMSVEIPPGAATRLARYRRYGGLVA